MESLANLMRSPIRLFFTLMAVYVASQSVVCAMFLLLVAGSWLFNKVIGRSHVVPTPRDAAMPKSQTASAETEPASVPQGPAYAKSPVVVPFNRQEAARRRA